MKVQKLNGFKIGGGIARSIAESRWGHGGTNAARTTRKGFHYYSCAGHGGYVISENSFTEEELEHMNYVATHCHVDMQLFIGYQDGEEVVYDYLNPFSNRAKTIRRPYGIDPIYGGTRHQVFLFEEDCDWAILEALTGVRRKWLQERLDNDETKYQNHIRENLQQWNPSVLEYLEKNNIFPKTKS